MDTDRIVQLLEEIRDLQLEHRERHILAVEDQKKSIQAQQEAIRLQQETTRRVQWIALPIILVILALLAWLIRYMW